MLRWISLVPRVDRGAVRVAIALVDVGRVLLALRQRVRGGEVEQIAAVLEELLRREQLRHRPGGGQVLLLLAHAQSARRPSISETRRLRVCLRQPRLREAVLDQRLALEQDRAREVLGVADQRAVGLGEAAAAVLQLQAALIVRTPPSTSPSRQVSGILTPS